MLNCELLDFYAISSLNAAQVLGIRYSSMERVSLSTSILPRIVTGTYAIMNLKLKSIGRSPISDVTNVKPDYQLKMFSGNVGEVLFDVVWVNVSPWKRHVATGENIPVWSWIPVKAQSSVWVELFEQNSTLILQGTRVIGICEVFILYKKTIGADIAAIRCDVKTGSSIGNTVGMTEKVSQWGWRLDQDRQKE